MCPTTWSVWIGKSTAGSGSRSPRPRCARRRSRRRRIHAGICSRNHALTVVVVVDCPVVVVVGRLCQTGPMPRCGAPCKDGTPCRHRVSASGRRCHQHRQAAAKGAASNPQRGKSLTTPRARRGSGARAMPRLTQRRESHRSRTTDARARRERRRVESAAVFCADAVDGTWQEAVAERATDYVVEATWDRLARWHRGRRAST